LKVMKAYLLSGVALAAAMVASAALALPPPPASAPTGASLPAAPAGAGAAAPAPSGGGSADAGITPGNSKAPIDITAEGQEVFQQQRLVIYKGNVEATQDTARLRTPELRIYYKAKDAQPGQPKQASTGDIGADTGGIDHIDAAGPVYYITPNENARGDHLNYVKDTNILTMTGNVVLVHGKDVAKGDRLVMNRNTQHDELFSDAPKTATGRVRSIIYPQQQQPGAQPAQKPASH
jgi:lipopolysaccharide export system protein LptA